jgi:hypothetical protein
MFHQRNTRVRCFTGDTSDVSPVKQILSVKETPLKMPTNARAREVLDWLEEGGWAFMLRHPCMPSADDIVYALDLGFCPQDIGLEIQPFLNSGGRRDSAAWRAFTDKSKIELDRARQVIAEYDRRELERQRQLFPISSEHLERQDHNGPAPVIDITPEPAEPERKRTAEEQQHRAEHAAQWLRQSGGMNRRRRR